MKKLQLPYLQNLFFKGLFTFTKGVKIGGNDINLEQEFSPVLIDKTNLEKYKAYFKLESKMPLAYLYLMAQRAQVSLMLDKNFTISIPGLIHISNNLELIDELNIDLPIVIKASVFVESKKEGSLKPVFKIEFYQESKLVAKCESVYVAKRKFNLPKKKRDALDLISNLSNLEKWKLSKRDAKVYAEISGDKNPIHIYSMVAKVLGFNSTIIHGWYLVSRAISTFEKMNKNEIKLIRCQFLKAVELPSEMDYLQENTKIQVVKNEVVLLEMIVE